jgi:ribosome-binding factor A
MSSDIRQKRVTGLLYEELSIMLGNELDDPRLSLVTVTDVVVSKDLKNVRVFVNHQDEEHTPRQVLAGLQKATPFLRSQVAERLSLRVAPELTFSYDESPARAKRLDDIFRQLAEERSAAASAAPEGGSPTLPAVEA